MLKGVVFAFLFSCCMWAARFDTWLLMKLTLKGVVFSFLLSSFLVAEQLRLPVSRKYIDGPLGSGVLETNSSCFTCQQSFDLGLFQAMAKHCVLAVKA